MGWMNGNRNPMASGMPVRVGSVRVRVRVMVMVRV